MVSYRDVPLKAALFDFDGTLVSLEIDFALMRRQVAAVIESYGIVWDELQGLFAIERIEEAAAILRKQHPNRAEQARRLAYAAIESLEARAAEKARLLPGVSQLIARLRNANVRTAVVTRNSRRSVEVVLNREPLPIDLLIARDDTPFLKPDPRHLLLALDNLSVPPAYALMVGDHPADVKAGRKAGALAMGVLNGTIEPQIFYQEGAAEVLNSVCELNDILCWSCG